MTTRMQGGEADTLETAVAVIPFVTEPALLVMTVTVDAMHRMAALNCSASTAANNAGLSSPDMRGPYVAAWPR